jgi:DNA-binding MarR family transcriptional regulator
MTVVALDSYVLETLMPDVVGPGRRPSAFIVYLALWQRTTGTRHRTVAVSLSDLAEATGLSRRAVQTALKWLIKRRLLTAKHDGATGVPAYTVLRPWARR